MFDIDRDYLLNQLQDLLLIPSPTGFTDQIARSIQEALFSLGYKPTITKKGAVVLPLEGKADDKPRACTAHMDTLGAIVKEIKPNGRLRLSRIGGFAWNTVEGEGCRIFTKSGKVIHGSLLIIKASAHIHNEEVGKLERTDANMEIRIDEITSSAAETRELGIEVGDMVAFDPRVEISTSGYIRSRHLDDKCGVACLLAVLKALQDKNLILEQRTTMHFSNYEEVGHGAASGLPADLAELLTVDMAVVGDGQNSDEHHTTICAKDKGGPYHYQFTKELQLLAEQGDIPYKMDVYPFYKSDGEAHWTAGGEARVALIGPGVDASHNYERTHMDALQATSKLILRYLLS